MLLKPPSLLKRETSNKQPVNLFQIIKEPMSPSKTKSLINYLKRFQPGAVAFSGGVDSTLLLYLTREAWSAPPLALSFNSPLLTAGERDRIETLGSYLGVRLHWLKTKEYLDPRFVKNTPSRCYYCKKSRIKQARPLLSQMGIEFLLDGTNADDLKSYRPGIRASKEGNIISPLALWGWTKKEIREASRSFGLPTWNQPSSPCMATRVAYGQAITLPLLKRLAQGEAVLHQLGFRECRLRFHHTLVRIEIPENELNFLLDPGKRHDLLTRLSTLGFSYITLDLKGFRSGSMDEGLKKRRRTASLKERCA